MWVDDGSECFVVSRVAGWTGGSSPCQIFVSCCCSGCVYSARDFQGSPVSLCEHTRHTDDATGSCEDDGLDSDRQLSGSSRTFASVLIEPFEHDSAAFNHGANETGV